MNNYLRLFLSTRGTINRRTFWHGIIVITAVNLALLGGGFWLQTDFWKPAHGSPPINLSGKFQFADLGILLTLWFTICVFTKRLRRLGATAWVQVPSRVLVAWGLISTSIATVWSSNESASLATVIFLGSVGLFVGAAIDLGLIFWLGTANPKAEKRPPSE